MDGFTRHVPVGQAVQHPQHAIGGDEGGDAKRRHHDAVEQPDGPAREKTGEDAQRSRAGVLNHRARKAGGQGDIGPHREIETGGQDHKRQARRDEKQQARLAQDIQNVSEAEEGVAEQRQHDANQQCGRQAVQQLHKVGRKSDRGGATIGLVMSVMIGSTNRPGTVRRSQGSRRLQPEETRAGP